MEWLNAQNLFAILTIIIADLMLAGDNALVIGLACRGLPPAQKRRALLWGTGGAVVLRII